MQQMYDFLDEQKFEMPFTLNPPANHLKSQCLLHKRQLETWRIQLLMKA